MVKKRNISKRETVTLNQLFTDIATAIRTKSGISESIYPVEMGNQIRNLKGIPSVQLDSVTLQTVFQDIADAIRSCDVYGKMTPTQMSQKIGEIVISHTLEIMSDDSLVGKTIYCRCYYDDELSAGEWSIVSGNQYASINENGKMDIVSGTQNKDVTVQCRCNGITAQRTFTVSYGSNQLAIKGPDTMTGTEGNIIFTWNDEFLPLSEVQFSITSGGNIASIDENAVISISGDGDIVVQATYNGITTYRTISVQYDANSHSQTYTGENGEVYTETETVIENQDGSTTTTSHSTEYGSDGQFIKTDTTTTTNQDGSSSTSQTVTNQNGSYSETQSTTTAPDQSGSTNTTANTVNYDESGNVTGSQTSSLTENTDGSSNSTTTNYDANGDPTDTTNQETDADANVSTQNVDYDENGDSYVTSYTIDTSNSESGAKDITGTGVNTEFVPFDGKGGGFVCHIKFKSVRTEQPVPPIVTDTEDSGQNYLYNVLNAMSPHSPYPGVFIRWAIKKSNGTGSLYFGYKYRSTGGTTQKVITGVNDVFDMNIIYDPDMTTYTSQFRVEDNQGKFATTSVNIEFPDNQVDFTLGYAISQAGTPYRYANVEIQEFTITKL